MQALRAWELNVDKLILVNEGIITIKSYGNQG